MTLTHLYAGSNAGIGFELVRLVAEKKHTIYLSGRNEAAVKAAVYVYSFDRFAVVFNVLKPMVYYRDTLHSEGLTNVKSVVLDVTKPASVEAARATIEAAEGRLDVLVNNAAVSMYGHDHNPTSVSVNTLHSAMETNFYGVVQTTSVLLPLLRKSANSVILNVSSGLGSNSYMSAPDSPHVYFPYCATKAALNSYTISLSYELKAQGTRVNAVTPGLTSTQLNNFVEGGGTPRQAAAGILHLVLLNKEGPTGKFFGPKGDEFPW